MAGFNSHLGWRVRRARLRWGMATCAGAEIVLSDGVLMRAILTSNWSVAKQQMEEL